MQELYQITNNKVDTLSQLVYTDDRAYASAPVPNWMFLGKTKPGLINVGNKKSEVEASMDLWHEFGHHLEFSNPNLKTVATNWIKSRTTGEIKSLNELYDTDKFGENEEAYVGNFGLGQYVAAIYKSGATEVISMGLERFISGNPMANFFRDDPEHFLLVLGILDSL